LGPFEKAVGGEFGFFQSKGYNGNINIYTFGVNYTISYEWGDPANPFKNSTEGDIGITWGNADRRPVLRPLNAVDTGMMEILHPEDRISLMRKYLLSTEARESFNNRVDSILRSQ